MFFVLAQTLKPDVNESSDELFTNRKTDIVSAALINNLNRSHTLPAEASGIQKENIMPNTSSTLNVTKSSVRKSLSTGFLLCFH